MKKNIYNLVHNSEVSEKSIERYLVAEVKKLGGMCLKFTSQTITGYPDRVILLPGGDTLWIELKSRGKHTSAIQKARIQQMRAICHTVYVCDSKESINKILNDYK